MESWRVFKKSHYLLLLGQNGLGLGCLTIRTFLVRIPVCVSFCMYVNNVVSKNGTTLCFSGRLATLHFYKKFRVRGDSTRTNQNCWVRVRVRSSEFLISGSEFADWCSFLFSLSLNCTSGWTCCPCPSYPPVLTLTPPSQPWGHAPPGNSQ